MTGLKRNLKHNLKAEKQQRDNGNSCNMSSFFHSTGQQLNTNTWIGLRNVHVHVLEWGVNISKFGKYDVILCADIVYLEDTFAALINTLQHLSSGDTLVLLACKIRYERDTKFLRLMSDKFHMDIINQLTDKDIYLYRAKLK